MKIVFVGDTIKLGYISSLEIILSEHDVIYSPYDDGDASQVHGNLASLVLSHAPDVVVLNSGLHDIERNFEVPVGLGVLPAFRIPIIPDYDYYWTDILTQIRTALPNTFIVWLQTTPVNESIVNLSAPYLYNVDVGNYNTHMLSVIANINTTFGVPNVVVFDLNAFIVSEGIVQGPDGINYSPPDNITISEGIAGSILQTILGGKKLYVTQRTNRHVIKRLNNLFTNSIEVSFGTFGTPQTDNTGFNFPYGVAVDGSNNVYVCDNDNSRIVKLDSNLVYISNVDVSTEIGRPSAIMFDSSTGDLYVAGVKDYRSISIARITTALSISKYNNDINLDADIPFGISRGFAGDDFIISRWNKVLKVVESGTFATATEQTITGEDSSAYYMGHTKHSNGDLYFAVNKKTGANIIRVNSSYAKIGSSERISAACSLVSETDDTNVIVYDVANSRVKKFTSALTFMNTVYLDTGDTISNDAQYITGIMEVNI